MARPWFVYLAMCLVVALLVASRAHEWNRAVQDFDSSLQPKWSPLSTEKTNQRFFLDNDPYYWVTYARQMIQTGTWRVRYTYADNVPYGRDVHWSQCVMWLLVGFGYVRHLFTGEPMVVAIEGASIWVNPFLLVLFTILFSWLISRRMGVGAGVFFALAFTTLPDIDWAFHPFRPGHHGLHLASSVGTVLCLVLGGLGWTAREQKGVSDRAPDRKLQFFRPLQLMRRKDARRYFMVAGVFTGLGLWIGATVQFFTIGAIAVGSVMLVFFMPAHQAGEDATYIPELWRVWGSCAAIVGTIFYLIEYFPSHMSLRLEVNNPLYIITVFCVGELMVQLTRWRLGDWRASFVNYLKILCPAAGVALVPLAFLCGPAQWHNMRDIQMSRLHNFIMEFYTYFNFQPQKRLETWFFNDYGILPFFLLGAVVLSGPRRTRLYEWAGLWISFFLCLFTLFLTLWQIRWSGLHGAMSVWLMIVVGHIVWRNVLSAPGGQRPIGIAVALSGLVLCQVVYFSSREFSNLRDIRNGKTPKEFIDAAMKKHLAEGLRAEGRGKPLRIICEPDLAPALYYFGGIQTVTSLYWENVQGLHDATAFFTDQGDAVAKRIARDRGLTHIIVSASNTLPAQFHYIETGDMSIADARSTLLARLYPSRDEAPPWIKLDQNMTAIGRREFSLRQARGVASLNSLMTIYRLQPDGTETQNPSQGSPSRP